MSDFIRREDATAVIRKTLGSLGNSVITEINSLSGYVADRPRGRWEFHMNIPCGKGSTSAGYVCSECWADYFRVDGMNYCPNCGAKMEVEE